MSDRQLKLVAQWERDKEDQAARQLGQAQQHLQQQKQKLASLQGYRQTYLNDLNRRGTEGLQAREYNHNQGFLSKLDRACEQQVQLISQASLVVDQRRDAWMAQQKKRKAVEVLLERKENQRQMAENRVEQNILDEFALQKFVRQQAI